MQEMADVAHVIHLSTGVGIGCEHCGQALGLERFAESINHLVDVHGYRLLHVGSEWDNDRDGNSIHHTVAVLGRAASTDW